jgi:hypothetical protein
LEVGVNIFRFKGDRREARYWGYRGNTAACLQSICAILNSGILPERVTIITGIASYEERIEEERHSFLFWDWGYFPLIVIPSDSAHGYLSGALGISSRGFALAICLIREKGIPIDGVYIGKDQLEAINKGIIKRATDKVFNEIKATNRSIDQFLYDWVPKAYKEALEDGQLWRHEYLELYEKNPISTAISNIELLNPNVGRKLRKAKTKAGSGIETEELQHAGQLIRDAWIELSQQLCDLENIDTSGIKKDNVSDKLKKLPADEKTLSLAKASFDLNSKVRHDRKITREITISCVMSSIFSMESLIYKYIDPNERFV